MTWPEQEAVILADVVFLHGVGGASAESAWLEPLNAGLASQGAPRIGEPTDNIFLPDYGDLFAVTPSGTEAPETSRKEDERTLLEHKLTFWARQKELERVVRRFAESEDIVGLHRVPGAVVDPLAGVTELLAFEEVTKFMKLPATRSAVYRHVLAQIPQSGHVILVAHSLGSVVAAGLLRRLPPELTVDLFVTIGSPLGIPRYRSHVGALTSSFPYRQVHRWLNVHSLRDFVTGGRGVAGSIDSAIDVAIQTNAHSLGAYMSHPATAAAIRSVVFPLERSAPGAVTAHDRAVSRPIHEAWFPLLLGTAFTHQLAKSMPTSEWKARLRLDAARSEVARRAVDDIVGKRVQRAELIRSMQERGVSWEPRQLTDHPLADNRYPTLSDLTTGAASLLRGTWNDEDLLALAVGLLMQPLVDPFDVQADLKQRLPALVLTLNVVRDHRGDLADQTYAHQVRDSLVWAQRQIVESKFPWGTVLIGTGVVVLAATGIGMMLAAPAGLAGAAVVTSTLAAFGPGGMVGGLLTLGALTGSASALGALGVSAEFEADDAETMHTAATARTVADLAPLSPENLTVTLVGMLAVIHAQTRLPGFRSTEPYARAVVTAALDTVRAEQSMHEEIAPGADGTKKWRRKQDLLVRALAALDSLTSVPEVGLQIEARKALETGRPPAQR